MLILIAQKELTVHEQIFFLQINRRREYDIISAESRRKIDKIHLICIIALRLSAFDFKIDFAQIYHFQKSIT